MKKAKDPCNIISLQHECKNPPAGFCQSHSYRCLVSGQNIVSAWGDIQTWQTVCLFNYLTVQSFIIKSRMRIPSNDTLHYFLSIKCNDDKFFKVCRLTQIPDRRTVDRRFQNLPIGDIIGTMGDLFVSEGMVDDTSASVDSSLLKANGPVWHKSDMKNNRLPISGIDTDARWGFSKSKGWIFGYKLHMSCSTGKLIVPLSAGVSTANIHDGKMFDALIKSLSGIIRNILADPAYDDSKLHDSCGKKHLRLVTPIRQYPRTPPERIKLVEFYDSAIGQELYADRKTSIEPLFEIFKDTFGIRAVPVKGLCNVKSSVLICVLAYSWQRITIA